MGARVKAGLCKTVGLTHDEGVADHVGGVVDRVPPQGGQVHAVHQRTAQQQNNAPSQLSETENHAS